jgi:hypothetical protein
MSTVVFRAINGAPIVWHDSRGEMHACEGTQLQAHILAYWSLCEIDVPPRAHELGDANPVTCATCRERMQQPAPSVVPEAGEAIETTPGPENFVRLLIKKPGR